MSTEKRCCDCFFCEARVCVHPKTSYTIEANNRRGGEPCGPEGKLWTPRTSTVPDMPKPPAPEPTCAADLLKSAQEIVNGDRQRDYGHPADNHRCTGALVEQWWDRADVAGNLAKLTPNVQAGVYVCAFNILQKLSRLAQTPTHTDSLRDIIGYCLNWQMILDRAQDAQKRDGKGGEAAQ